MRMLKTLVPHPQADTAGYPQALLSLKPKWEFHPLYTTGFALTIPVQNEARLHKDPLSTALSHGEGDS